MHRGSLDLFPLTQTTRLDSVELADLLRRRLASMTLPNVSILDAPDSVAIARSLASSAGFVALPNLRAASPLALAALRSKADMVLPPDDAIELLPEP